MPAVLEMVTMTGADDSVDVARLRELSTAFPFVEWGILASASNWKANGGPRFPSESWIARFCEMKANNPQVRASLHLCGQWVRDLLRGTISIGPLHILRGFDRVQLNFHAEQDVAFDPLAFASALDVFGRRQIIFQIDGHKGVEYFESTRVDGSPNHVPLFDASGGAGIVPQKWPEPTYLTSDAETHSLHGYAGGLSPDNLAVELPRIIAAAGENCPRIWIDAETHIRSTDDAVFDLAKVHRFLRQCVRYTAPSGSPASA